MEGQPRTPLRFGACGSCAGRREGCRRFLEAGTASGEIRVTPGRRCPARAVQQHDASYRYGVYCFPSARRASCDGVPGSTVSPRAFDPPCSRRPGRSSRERARRHGDGSGSSSPLSLPSTWCVPHQRRKSAFCDSSLTSDTSRGFSGSMDARTRHIQAQLSPNYRSTAVARLDS